MKSIEEMIKLGLSERCAKALNLRRKGKTYTYIGEQYLNVSRWDARRVCSEAERRLEWLTELLKLKPRSRGVLIKLGFESKAEVDEAIDGVDYLGYKLHGIGPKRREEICDWLNEGFEWQDIATAPTDDTVINLLNIENYIVTYCVRCEIPVRGDGWRDADDWYPAGSFKKWQMAR